MKATLHWVSAPHAIEREVRLYDRLFTRENPDQPEEGKSFIDYVNPDSLQVLTGCKLEPALAEAEAGVTYQFERKGYFCPDAVDAGAFNRAATLRDAWKNIQKRKG